MVQFRKVLILIGITAGFACASVGAQTSAVDAQTSASQPSTQKVQKHRIGVYDSRAVAVAYAGSAKHRDHLKEITARWNQAKARNDKAELARLDADAKARQEKQHLQAFSTAPVDDILGQMKEELLVIQRQAKIETVVSKWDKKGLGKYDGAERVDVTPALIDAFHPNKQQRKSAQEIQKHKPYPADVIKKIKD